MIQNILAGMNPQQMRPEQQFMPQQMPMMPQQQPMQMDAYGQQIGNLRQILMGGMR